MYVLIVGVLLVVIYLVTNLLHPENLSSIAVLWGLFILAPFTGLSWRRKKYSRNP